MPTSSGTLSLSSHSCLGLPVWPACKKERSFSKSLRNHLSSPLEDAAPSLAVTATLLWRPQVPAPPCQLLQGAPHQRLQRSLLARMGMRGWSLRSSRPGAQALCVGAQAMPGKPLLIVEDDIQVASLFSLRLSRLITAVEVRAASSERSAAWCLACLHVPNASRAARLCRSAAAACAGGGPGQALRNKLDGDP